VTTFENKIGHNQHFERYIQRWGLQRDPFAPELPSMDAFVPSQRDDIRKLKWTLTDSKLGILTGGLGMGKTTICKFLIASLKEENLATTDLSKQVVPAFVHGATYKSTEELLRAIILGVEMDAKRDRASLFEILRRWPNEHQEGLAILIDDVPESGSDIREMGEFLRVLTDIPGIAVLLNGEPKRMQRFLSEIPSLRDRVQTHVELKPMKSEEIGELIKLRLKNAGCAHYSRLVSPNALNAIYKLSKGVPRQALKVAGNALHYAAEKNKRIDANVVRKANKRPRAKRISIVILVIAIILTIFYLLTDYLPFLKRVFPI